MRMGYELAIEQQQKLVMTPELKLALKILQLPSIELEEFIQNELETNPILEIAEEHTDEKNKEQIPSKGDEKDIDWKEYLQFQGKSYGTEGSNREDFSELSYDNLITYSNTLKEHLHFQLHLSFINPTLKEIGEFIIDSLDENGYLAITVEELAKILKTEVNKVEKVLYMIQTFEPAGVGARNIQECMLIQLRNKGIDLPILNIIIADFLDDIASNRLNNISKKLSISIEEAQRYSDLIKSLEPKPGRAFEGGNATRYVTPDVFIDKAGSEYIITVNDYHSSRLGINQYYKSLLNSEDKSSEATSYINNKLSSAMWLIRSLENRKNTLYNVVKAILEYQLDFFEHGVMYLKTMTLKNIAEIIDMHESTVSRAINGKYVQTPRGVFEIKYFFKSGVDSQEGDAVSSESIKTIIKSYIGSENSAKPVSDQNIADYLVQNGYMISRRTVAKYRDELGIPPSSRRKRYL